MLLALFIISPLVIATESNRGLEIAKETENRSKGFIDLQAKLKMVITNRSGKSFERVLRVRILENENGGGNKTMNLIDSPKDLLGSVLLTHNHINKLDNQWLYLPSLKRVKRINSRNKSGPFLSSEFAYEDMTIQNADEYTYKYINQKSCGNTESCFMIERYPKDKYSGYTSQTVWIDSKEYRIYKIDYYDKKGQLLKTLSFQEYSLFDNKFWHPKFMHMINHVTNKKTSLIWTDYKFNSNLNKNDFNYASLKRIK